MASKFEERRDKIDNAATHGNPQFGRDQLDALRAHAENDAAEALTALVGLVGELTDRLGGWQRIGVTDGQNAPAPIALLNDDGTTKTAAQLLEEAGRVLDDLELTAAAQAAHEDEQTLADEYPAVDEEDDLPLEVGDLVGVVGETTVPRPTGIVLSVGTSEGRDWATVEGETFPEGAKVWAEQLERVNAAPEETERTNPEDGAEQRAEAAKRHLEHVVDEPKVEYEQSTYDAGRDGKEFDVPIGMVGAPVKVKPKGK